MKDILGGHKGSPQVARAKTGGVKRAIDVNSYQKPLGPTNQSQKGPGLHGTVHHCGSQGEHSLSESEGGNIGLHGTTQRHGSQR